ncbi:MAG: lactate racemase domain-containing protein [Alkalispirochaetaceae bacterium]
MSPLLYLSEGGPQRSIDDNELRQLLYPLFDAFADARSVLAIPPDFTRYHSRAGRITEMLYQQFGSRLTDVLPAVGSHEAMSPEQIRKMFGSLPPDRIRNHRWREDTVTLGRIPARFIEEVSEGALSFDFPVQLNRMISEAGHDVIFSVGQVVPHEVIGLANYTKNIFIGTGGKEAIDKSHYLGAVYGMERIMGEADTPVRQVINRAARQYAREFPIVYILTVLENGEDGSMILRGVYAGDDDECFLAAAELSKQVNVYTVPAPVDHVVAYLDEEEFHSTWLGNKAVYRSRMMIADGGRLTVIAPGVAGFGEDREIDALIREYGYHGTPHTLALVDRERRLRENLSAAAHLIHGSSEGRFTIEYAPGALSREEIEGVGYEYLELEAVRERYSPHRRSTGFHRDSEGETFYFIANPALGLWRSEGR